MKGRAVHSSWGRWTRCRPAAAGATLCRVCFEWQAVPVGSAGGSGASCRTADRSGVPASSATSAPSAGRVARLPLHPGPWASAPGRTARGSSGGHLGAWPAVPGGRGFRGAQPSSLRARVITEDCGSDRVRRRNPDQPPSSPGPTWPSNSILFSSKKQRCFKQCWLQFEKYNLYLIR